jgi:hypothetical protein
MVASPLRHSGKENAATIRGEGEDHSDDQQRGVPIRRKANTEWIHRVKKRYVDVILKRFVVFELDKDRWSHYDAKAFCSVYKLAGQCRPQVDYWRT